MTKDILDLYKESKINRFNFLEAKKKEWLDCESERKKNDLIVELIQSEPSHLAEDWILNQVIKWMKDRQNNIDYINAAFIARGRREELTEKKRNNLAETFFLSHKINKLAEKKGTIKAAITYLVSNLPESEDSELSEQPVEAIAQKLKRYRKALDNRVLPFPYYGLDFIEIDKGNENHRIEYYIFNKPITHDGCAFFGNTKMSFPLKTPTK